MEIRGSFFIFHGLVYKNQQQNEVLVEHQNSIYEVLRVINSIPIFLEDHYERFENSFKKIGSGNFPTYNDIKEILNQLINRNNISEGNIRIDLFFSDINKLSAYFIPHYYPSDEVYKKGIKLVSFPVERLDPEVKQTVVNKFVRQQVDKLQKETDAYEILLTNQKGQITEGSKSNIFMVRDKVIYTPPSEQVLKGITRQKTISLANKYGIKLLEKTIELNTLNTFEACFITGTSPKLLPVNSIDSNLFNTNNEEVKTLMNAYNELIHSYCLSHRE